MRPSRRSFFFTKLVVGQLQPVGQCQKFNKTELYRETTTNTTFPYKTGSSGGHVDINGDGKIDTAIAIGVPKGSTLMGLAAVLLAGFLL